MLDHMHKCKSTNSHCILCDQLFGSVQEFRYVLVRFIRNHKCLFRNPTDKKTLTPRTAIT